MKKLMMFLLVLCIGTICKSPPCLASISPLNASNSKAIIIAARELPVLPTAVVPPDIPRSNTQFCLHARTSLTPLISVGVSTGQTIRSNNESITQVTGQQQTANFLVHRKNAEMNFAAVSKNLEKPEIEIRI